MRLSRACLLILEGGVASDEREGAAQPYRSDQVGRPGFRIGDPDKRDQEHGRERRDAGDVRDGIEQRPVMVGPVEASEAQKGDCEEGIRPKQLSTLPPLGRVARASKRRGRRSGPGRGRRSPSGQLSTHVLRGPGAAMSSARDRAEGAASVTVCGAIGHLARAAARFLFRVLVYPAHDVRPLYLPLEEEACSVQLLPLERPSGPKVGRALSANVT